MNSGDAPTARTDKTNESEGSELGRGTSGGRQTGKRANGNVTALCRRSMIFVGERG
jgi:hypothetical protein